MKIKGRSVMLGAGRMLLVTVLLMAPAVRARAAQDVAPAPSSGGSRAQSDAYDTGSPVELNGDSIEFKAEESKFVVNGNVVLKQNNAVLFCDKLDFYRDKKEAHASGNIILESPKGTVWADEAFYNFGTKRGEFTNARILAHPYFGKAASITKFHDDYYVLSEGWLSTSDFDDPEYRLKARKIEVYPADRAVARSTTLYLGAVPVMYVPKYVQYLDDNRPHFRLIPGYSKGFGAFALMSTRMMLTDSVETTYHVDLMVRKGVGYGVDATYNAWQAGSGIVKTYYIKERQLVGERISRSAGTTVTGGERYRAEWRHQWDIDRQTSFISQYYKLSDADFLKDYFSKEYQQDQAPQTFALLTRSLPNANMSLRTDFLVNKFNNVVERLPEVSYNLISQPLGDSGFYLKSSNAFANLRRRNPTPAGMDYHTQRFDTDNELSRPFKFSFLELRPFAGTEQTFYSSTLDVSRRDVLRGIFRTGMDVSTRFYRLYDLNFDRYGIEVNKLRHVVTPTIGYLYQHRPTLPSDKLFAYDSVDARDTVDSFSLGLGNTLQTKRKGKSVDILRSLFTTDFRLKDNPSPGSFGNARLVNELYPNDYVTLHTDAEYNNDTRHLQTANFDLYLKDNKRWEFNVGKRYTYHDDDLLSTQLSMKINPKWRTVIYERWNLDTGHWQEQQYSVVRDLHSWEVELAVNNKKEPEKSGTEFWIIFRIKAFPSVQFDGGTTFNKKKVN
jgi:lipopolysaccharide assembly outer membrane protein LptD (OstA)